MAEELKLTISSPNNNDYDICLSKFFCMVFFDKKGKQLEAFFATVFGGYRKSSEGFNHSLPSSYHKNKEALLKFDFSNNNLIEIVSTDLTSSFLTQGENLVPLFWGGFKKYNNQYELTKDFEKIYGDSFSKSSYPSFNNEDFYCIGPDNNGELKLCAVTNGMFNQESTAFTLTSKSNESGFYDGFQFINWIKCKISLSENIIGKITKLSIILDGIQYTPDFTWYFAPPVDYEVENPRVRYGTNGNEPGGWDINKVSVADDRTTVLFEEWVKLQIGHRKKSRVNLNKNINVSSIDVEFNIREASGLAVTRQFFYGLFIAFLLSYFADQTRAKDFVDCFCFSENIQNFKQFPTLLLPVMVGFCALNLLYKIKQDKYAKGQENEKPSGRGKKEEKKKKKHNRWFHHCFWSMILTAVIYLLVPIFPNFISDNKILEIIIISLFGITLLVSTISNILYFLRIIKLHERPLGDIL